jgi:hydrogenase nickel incorporation protein HypA/HybF
MHEASIVESLLCLVKERVGERSRIRRIHVRVGCFTGVSPDAMQFYFEAMREDSVGRDAELTVLLEPLRALCPCCGGRFAFPDVQWSCPSCGGGLVYENGNELDLVAVEVEDDSDHPDAGENPRQERGARERKSSTV